jgi:ribonuclease VapC
MSSSQSDAPERKPRPARTSRPRGNSPPNAEAAPTSVLDASALLAWLHDEDGAVLVGAALDAGAAISIVNWTEALSKVAADGREPETLIAQLAEIGIDEHKLSVEPITKTDAILIARLRPATTAQGLSLADRACLTLAARLRIPAITADRAWADVNVDAEVTLIR